MIIMSKYGKVTRTPYAENFAHLPKEEIFQKLLTIIKVSQDYYVETSQKMSWEMPISIPVWKEFKVVGIAMKTGRKIMVLVDGEKVIVEWGSYNAREYCDNMITHLSERTGQYMKKIMTCSEAKQKHPELEWDLIPVW